MSPLVSNLLKSILLPPGILIFIALAGIILLLRKRTLGLVLVSLSTLLLYVFSTPFFSSSLASMLEPEAALDPASPGVDRAEAIVVLGCGRYYNAPEYGGADDVSACSLVRLRYALELLRYREMPILLSGGGHGQESVSEAEIMDRILQDHMGRQALWLETSSRNTFENARLSADLLSRYEIDTILLVTHAVHMKRAALAFEKNRINVIPAPAYFYSDRRIGDNFLDFLPSVSALQVSFSVMREILGILWFLYSGAETVRSGG